MPKITDNMTADEQIEFKEICTGEADYFDASRGLQDKLYEWYLDSGEMPYGIAKARTGDPDEWIQDRLEQEYFE